MPPLNRRGLLFPEVVYRTAYVISSPIFQPANLTQPHYELSSEMSLNRLTFLYPHLWKCARGPPPSLPSGPLGLKRKRSSRSRFSTISQHHEETFPQRYGTAAEPQTLSNSTAGKSEQSKTLADAIEKEINAPAPPRPEKRSSPNTSQTKDESITTTSESSAQGSSKPSPLQSSADETAVATPSASSKEALMEPTDRPSKVEGLIPPENEDHKPPHLQAPPYVHNFDTYTIVRDLKKGGFTHDQSVTLTKAVRGLLGVNLDIARQGLVSKSDMENVSMEISFYFFFPIRKPKQPTSSLLESVANLSPALYANLFILK